MSDLMCLVGGERTAHKKQLGSFSIPQPCCWCGVVGERGAHNQAIHPHAVALCKSKGEEGNEGEGERKSSNPVLMKSVSSKHDASACLTRINPSYPHLPALCEMPMGSRDKKELD